MKDSQPYSNSAAIKKLKELLKVATEKELTKEEKEEIFSVLIEIRENDPTLAKELIKQFEKK